MRGILKKLAARAGFIHNSELDENKLMELLCEQIGNPYEYVIDKKAEDELFKTLKDINYLHDYLTATCAKDIQRHFGATSDSQRDVVKGAFARTVYMRSRLRKTKAPLADDELKLDGLRYG